MSTTEILLLTAGLAVGGLIAWFWAAGRTRAKAADKMAELQNSLGASDGAAETLRGQLEERQREVTSLRETLTGEQQARIKAQAEMEASLKNIEAQKKLLDDAEKRLKETFGTLSLEAQREYSKVFSRQADEKVKPLQDMLVRYEKLVREMEKARQTAYGSVTEQVQAIRTTHEKLHEETRNLVTALRAPEVKGRWGEITLRRVVEVAGMSAHCDFVEQQTIRTDDGPRIRPDLIVKLPGDRAIIVDSKAPLKAYLAALNTEDKDARRAGFELHAKQIRNHMKDLSRKDYRSQFQPMPDFVVMFLPGESFFSAALEQDRTLIEDCLDKKIILASPTTLIALLRTVAHVWQQQQMTENAQKIASAGRKLFERICVFTGHLADIGDNIRRTTEVYNNAVGSWVSRVEPEGRRMTELGASSKDKELPLLKEVDEVPRALPETAAREPLALDSEGSEE